MMTYAGRININANQHNKNFQDFALQYLTQTPGLFIELIQ